MVRFVLGYELLKEIGETAGVSAIPTTIALYREEGKSSEFDFKQHGLSKVIWERCYCYHSKD